jgi:radical SAM superfamily enzyme YgiQ (UPF0313 family)
VYPAAPLGLITVAALLPKDWELRLVDRNTVDLTDADLDWADLVLTGGMLPQQRDTLRVLELAHEHGKPVVVGGPDVSSSPHIYARADFQVLGEAEEILGGFVKDWTAGVRKGVYKAEAFPDVTKSPVPRFDLLDFSQYLHVGVQYSRGCPYNCEFCDIIELYGRRPRTKTSEQMLHELDVLRAAGYRGHVDFVDDNLIGNKKLLKEFLPNLTRWQRQHGDAFEFTTEATINLADDDELMAMMQDAGFFAIFVGIESPDTGTLLAMQKQQNTRRSLVDSVHKIYRRGMFVNAGFILGFDTEQASVARPMVECIEATAIPVCMVGLLYALPNTQLTRRLEREERLHPMHDAVHGDDDADQCTSGLNFDTARPRERVLEDYDEVLTSVYDPAAYFRRVRAVGRELDCSKRRFRQPLHHVARDVRSFLRMAWRMGVRNRSVRAHWWRTMADCVGRNPRAIRYVGALCALYAHLGPFAESVRRGIARKLEEGERSVKPVPRGSQAVKPESVKLEAGAARPVATMPIGTRSMTPRRPFRQAAPP